MRVIGLVVLALVAWPVWAAERLELVMTFQAAAMVRIDDRQHRLQLGGPDVDGVTLVSITGDEADVGVEDKVYHLRPGVVQALGYGHGGSRVIIAVNRAGQYVTGGSINDIPVSFIVDTGANTVAMSRAQADRIGLDYAGSGRQGVSMTAGGNITSWVITLHKVRVGGIEVGEVAASVIDGPGFPDAILLGMSFLDRVKLTHQSGRLVLQAP